MTSTRIIILNSLLLLSIALIAQEKPVIKATVDKTKVLLGEPFTLKLELQLPGNAKGSLPVIDSLPHFEQAGEPKIDSSSSGGTKLVRGEYYFTSFDSGHWVIPPFRIDKNISTDTIGMDVLFAEFDPQQPYHDIKDIIDVKAKKKNPWWWYAAGGGLLILLLVIYLLRRRKPVAAPKPVSRVDPYQEAMQQLQELQRTKPEPKQYYSKLTDIFRLYLFRKKGILSLQKTTDDLVVQLKDIGLPKENFEKVSQSLRLCDFVKFAKYNPTDEDNQHCFNDILNAMKTIELSGS